jgi:hypothetical protein
MGTQLPLSSIKYLQVELLVPFRIELLRDRFGPLFRLSHLHGRVRVRRPRLILGYQALSADY